jgi:hypothetical protein
VRRRSCSRYQIPSHYPLLPRNVSVLDECSECSKATMATNATPLSLVLSLFVCLVLFFFFPPSPLLPLPPSFHRSSFYPFSIFVVCEWMMRQRRLGVLGLVSLYLGEFWVCLLEGFRGIFHLLRH